MSERTAALAERFEAAHEGFAAFLEGLSQSQWRTLVPGEERTVAALAHHVAWAYAVEIAAFYAMAVGAPVAMWTRESLDATNARHGEEYAECDREETLDLARRNAIEAASTVRRLTDVQLQREGRYSASGSARSVERWIEMVLIGHIETHLGSMREALGID